MKRGRSNSQWVKGRRERNDRENRKSILDKDQSRIRDDEWLDYLPLYIPNRLPSLPIIFYPSIFILYAISTVEISSPRNQCCTSLVYFDSPKNWDIKQSCLPVRCNGWSIRIGPSISRQLVWEAVLHYTTARCSKDLLYVALQNLQWNAAPYSKLCKKSLHLKPET